MRGIQHRVVIEGSLKISYLNPASINQIKITVESSDGQADEEQAEAGILARLQANQTADLLGSIPTRGPSMIATVSSSNTEQMIFPTSSWHWC
jgi:hypothetical protein